MCIKKLQKKSPKNLLNETVCLITLQNNSLLKYIIIIQQSIINLSSNYKLRFCRVSFQCLAFLQSRKKK